MVKGSDIILILVSPLAQINEHGGLIGMGGVGDDPLPARCGGDHDWMQL
jgi:hypothetical protein